MNYDVGIIGAGVAGAFAALRLAERHKNIKAIIFDLGRPPSKRRRQLEGWFGCFPTGDGKVYATDLPKIMDITDGRSTRAINKWFTNHLDEVNPAKLIKTKHPTAAILKRIKNDNFDIEFNNYTQWMPDNIHRLSRLVADRIEDGGNITFSFDNEVFNISKEHGVFNVSTSQGEYKCKKLILCAGRTGWRWVNKLYRDLGILISDDKAMFGIRIELPSQYLKDFNKSHCTLIKPDLRIGPLSWHGSIIQEDHADVTTAAFRSNENRWKSDKVFFSIIGMRQFENEGCRQTDRLSKLAFLLFGDRVGRERLKTLTQGASQLNFLKEYSWLIDTIHELENIMPALVSRGYYHCPDIYPMTSKIRIGSNLETEVDGLFVAGESASIPGIAAAGITGALAAEGVAK